MRYELAKILDDEYLYTLHKLTARDDDIGYLAKVLDGIINHIEREEESQSESNAGDDW